MWALRCLQDCPETNWQLKTALATRKSEQKQKFETKTEQKRGKRKKKEQDTTTSTKGGQAQQSVASSHYVCVMLTVPTSCPLIRREGAKRSEESLHSDTSVTLFIALTLDFSSSSALFRFYKQYLRVENNCSVNTEPPPPPYTPFTAPLNKASSPSSSSSSFFLCNYFNLQSHFYHKETDIIKLVQDH